MKNRIKTISLSGLVTSIVFSSCTVNSIVGSWVEPVPAIENNIQGITLKKGGTASSINMATLQYEKWEQHGSRLLLYGKSIGNGTTISFTDTFNIEKLTKEDMVLKKGELTIKYKKQ